MKRILLIVFISIVSCSDDNVSPVMSAEKDLYKITHYINSASQNAERFITEFEDNKPVRLDRYGFGGQQVSYTNYIYNNEGLLTNIEEYLLQGNALLYQTNIFYDELGRLTITEHKNYSNGLVNPVVTNRNFTHNDNNTITSDGYTYYINNNGLIYKELDPWGNIKEKVFDNNNILSLSFENSYTEYNYLTEYLPKGQLINVESNKYGAFRANADLFNGFLGNVNPTDNYIDSFTNVISNSSYYYTYEFDIDGYPIKRSYYNANMNSLIFIEEITYRP